MRSGCLILVVRVGVVAFATILTAVSLALIASLAVSALGRPSGLTSVVGAIVACVAALSFFLVGRSIWRELRGQRAKPGDRGDGRSAGDGRS